MCCLWEDGYQRRLALLLAESCRCPEVPAVVSPDLLSLPVDFGHLYYVENRSYKAREFQFESCILDRQKIFGA